MRNGVDLLWSTHMSDQELATLNQIRFSAQYRVQQARSVNIQKFKVYWTRNEVMAALTLKVFSSLERAPRCLQATHCHGKTNISFVFEF